MDIDRKYLEPKRNDATTLEEAFMLHALIASSNSKDPSTQVGACYVSEDGKLLSAGCNRVPPKWNEDEFPWGTKEEYGVKNSKYTYIIHAEMAAMANYKGPIEDFKNSTLYITLFPCTNCAKLIASLGVKKIVYLNARKNCDEFVCASILLNKSNIECVNFKELDSTLIQRVELDINAGEKENVKIKRLDNKVKVKFNLK